MTDRRVALGGKCVCWLVVAPLATALALFRIASTHGEFSQTYDEPFHISRGMQWWSESRYSYVHHPPLAPLAFAAGPLLLGVEAPKTGDKLADGNTVLYDSAGYQRVLTAARVGNLAFFCLAAFSTWLWGKYVAGEFVATLGVVLLSLLPPILAHAGLATTDLAISATLPLTVFCFSRWLDSPSVRKSVYLGLATGLALIAKYSSLVFLPVSFGVILGVRFLFGKGRSKELLRVSRKNCGFACLTGYIAACSVMSSYQFSFGPVGHAVSQIVQNGFGVGTEPGMVQDALVFLERVPIPAPEYVRGIASVVNQNHAGRAMFFLGEAKRESGSLLFFPVVLGIKTPIGFLFLSLLGAVACLKRLSAANSDRWVASLLIPVCLVLAVLPSDINLGVRHILVVYPFLAVIAASGARECWNANRYRIAWRLLVTSSCAAIAGVSLSTHPDYISYFNTLAGNHPEDIVVDSDLDWGQDLDRLSTELATRSVDRLSLAYFGTAIPKNHEIPPFRRLRPFDRPSGWIAISMFELKTEEGYRWLAAADPVAMAGTSILLYHIDANGRPTDMKDQ